MKAFKIILRETKEENKWPGYIPKGGIKVGEVVFPFKNEEMDLKKGDIVYFQDDYLKELILDGKEYVSTNPANLICQK